jgi:acetolactate synthase-1/2/3 large subunit
MTKHNYLVRDADDLPRVFAEAFHIARTGRPGPVHIDITKDALQQETKAEHPDEAEVIAGLPGFRPNMDGHPRQLKLAAAEIARAKRPMILAGTACSWRAPGTSCGRLPNARGSPWRTPCWASGRWTRPTR